MAGAQSAKQRTSRNRPVKGVHGFPRLTSNARPMAPRGLPTVGDKEPDGNGRVTGCNGIRLRGTVRSKPRHSWIVEKGAAWNYRRTGRLLAEGCEDLYRQGADGHALLKITPDGKVSLIARGTELAPTLVDNMKMRVLKDRKAVSELPTAVHLNTMLRSETFSDASADRAALPKTVSGLPRNCRCHGQP
jgi:hypothetical protein